MHVGNYCGWNSSIILLKECTLVFCLGNDAVCICDTVFKDLLFYIGKQQIATSFSLGWENVRFICYVPDRKGIVSARVVRCNTGISATNSLIDDIGCKALKDFGQFKEIEEKRFSSDSLMFCYLDNVIIFGFECRMYTPGQIVYLVSVSGDQLVQEKGGLILSATDPCTRVSWDD